MITFNDLLTPQLENFSHILKSSSQTNSYLIIGKRDCGKTYLIKNIISQYAENDLIGDVYIFTHNNNNFDDIVNDNKYIVQINNINELNGYLEKIISNQVILINNNEKNIKNTLIIFDDVWFINSKKINDIIKNMRHYKIKFICSIQFPIKFSPEIRCSFDYVCCFKDAVLSNLKRMYEHYFGLIPFKTFQEIMYMLNSYNCLIVSQCNYTSSDITKKLFRYKPEYNQLEKKIILTQLLLDETQNSNNVNTNNDNLDIYKKIEKNNKLIKKITEKNNQLLKLLNNV